MRCSSDDEFLLKNEEMIGSEVAQRRVSYSVDSGSIPKVLNSRVLGLNAAMPQYAAGRLTEAMVWVPSAAGTVPAATAAAEPLLDPPGVCSILCGLRAGDGSK